MKSSPRYAMPIPILDEHTAAQVAELFRSFSDTSRIRIMSARLSGEKNVGVLAQLIGVSDRTQAAVLALCYGY